MAHDRYTGKEGRITFDAGVGHFRSIAIDGTNEYANEPSSDSGYAFRVLASRDARITIEGYDSDATGALSFADVEALRLSQAAPSALAWTDDAGTPVTRLPANYFSTHFPLAGWRIESCSGGGGGQGDVSTWTAVLTPRHAS